MLYTALSFIVSFIIALGILVFVHELGHFLVAKKAGIRVDRFSLGFPPKMFGVQVGETEYCISWIPFGGYVKVAGMADVGADAATGEPWEFPSKPIWVRMAVIFAGPLMNFIFAFVAFTFVFLQFGIETRESTVVSPEENSASARAGLVDHDRIVSVDGQEVANSHELIGALRKAQGEALTLEIQRDKEFLTLELPASAELSYGLSIMAPTLVGSVESGMPAEEIGLLRGDRITRVAGHRVRSWSEMSSVIRQYPEKEIEIGWKRRGQYMQAQVTPAESQRGGETIGLIGIGRHISRVEVGPGEAVIMGAKGVYGSSWLILDFLGELFQGDRSADELGGPLRIAQLAGKTAEQGASQFIYFLAFLSVQLAILNLLPIPVLDGGHLTFLSLEAIMRRPPSVRVRELSQQIGLAIMLCIMVLVVFNDLNQMVLQHILKLF